MGFCGFYDDRRVFHRFSTSKCRTIRWCLTKNVELPYYRIVQQDTISKSQPLTFDSDRRCQWIHSIFIRVGGVQLRPEDNPENCSWIAEKGGQYCQKHQMIHDLVNLPKIQKD